MKKTDNTNIFCSATNAELLSCLREIHSMDISDIVLLKQEFINREMFEESFAIDTFFSNQFDPSRMSLKEIQALVSDRLQTGESIASIKLDLADHGITLENLINNEAIRVDAIAEKIAAATADRKDEVHIDAELKKEYNLSDEEIIDVKRNVKGRTRLYTIIAILVGLFYAARFFFKFMR